MKYRVIRSDGVRSKPTSVQRIIEMYQNGKISEDSMVRQEGGSLEMPVAVFVDLNSIGSNPAPDSPHTTFVPNPTPPESPQEPPKYTPLRPAPWGGKATRKSWRDDDEPIELWSGLWHLLSFRGMKIPRDNRTATKDYLSFQITWIERYVKILHFVIVLYAWFLVISAGLLVYGNSQAIYEQFATRGFMPGLRSVIETATIWVFTAVGALAGFCLLRMVEALLRLVPACLRYWIAISEAQTPAA